MKLAWQVDLTPDGSIAALQDGNSFTGDLYFYHTETGAIEFATAIGDPTRDFATGMSANGTVSALHGDPVQAGLWTKSGGWTDISSVYRTRCGEDIAGGWDVSADGRSMVGLVWHGCNAEAFRWDAAGSGVMTPLELLGENYPGNPNPPSNRATVISDDGAVAAGFAQIAAADRWAAIWQADGSGTLLAGLANDRPSEVLTISADGGVAAGIWGMNAFYWTATTGMVDMGILPDATPDLDPHYANAVAADGQLIFGGSGSPWFSIPRAFVWTQAEGMRVLADVMAEAGLPLPEGYLLTNVIAASNDGTVILGAAYDPDGWQVSFVLRLPLSAYGL